MFAAVICKLRQTRKGVLLHGENLTGVVHGFEHPVMNAKLGIDTIDPAYYTVADGDGHTKSAREAGVDMGRGPGPAAQCRAPVPRVN